MNNQSNLNTSKTTYPPVYQAPQAISAPDTQNLITQCVGDTDKVENACQYGKEVVKNSPNKTLSNVDSGFLESQTQRKNELMVSSDEVDNDWSKCFHLLPSWEGTGSSSKQMEDLPEVEKISSSTYIEYGDTIICSETNPLKVITAVPRNINEYHIAVTDKKIPEKWMLDKSTTTNYNNNILTDAFNCPQKEQHFNLFRKLFKNIARSDLRNIFDTCLDVNWAVNIVLKGGVSNKLDIVDSNDCSDTEAEEQDDYLNLCQCLAAYDVIPDYNDSLPPPVIERNKKSNEYLPTPARSKGKKERTVSESSIQLKQQIERNVVISDSHYSEHCLKIRKRLRGELFTEEESNTNEEQTNTETSEPHTTESYIASSHEQYTPSHSNSSTSSTLKVENVAELCDEDSSIVEDKERTIKIDLGGVFLSKIDEIFGRVDMIYPSKIRTTINMPMSILNEINTLWIQSFMEQLEKGNKESEMTTHHDGKTTYHLALNERDSSPAEKPEPEVPDLQETHENLAEWRNHMSDDRAAILTRERLYNLFPELPKEDLSELLMAHDNNFQQTVEDLLISTGKSEFLESKNGIEKFIKEKEKERQEKFLEEEKKAIAEVEWPLFPKTGKIKMSVVEHYRDEASKHLRTRNLYNQKAQEFMRRGMIMDATDAFNVAAFHDKLLELSDSHAVTLIMQMNARGAADNSIIDLHNLRVAEAKVILDLFIDSHIKKLREMRGHYSFKIN